MRRITIVCLLVLGISATQMAQTNKNTKTSVQETNYAIFKSGTSRPANWLDPQHFQQFNWDPYYFEGFYYLLAQYGDYPDELMLQRQEQEGVHLVYYIPDNTFLLKVSKEANLSEYGITRIAPYLADYKLSEELSTKSFPEHIFDGERIWVNAITYPGIPRQQFADAVKPFGLKQIISESDKLQILIAPALLLHLAAHPAVMYLEPIEGKPVPEGVVGRSLHVVNQVNSGPGNSSGNYDGGGVAIAIGDDGTVDHLDFKNRIQLHTSSNVGDHGDMVAGILSGAGNLNPLAIGMAPASTLHVYKIDNYPQVTNAIQHYQDYGTIITSTSYGEGCGAFYNTNAHDLDWQMYQHNKVLHFFSAGNSAVSTCNMKYGNIIDASGNSFGNITGGRKSAKHSVAVANVYYNDILHNSSSRGPTLDGRVKPDLSGQGQGQLTTDSGNEYRLGGGTSAASPSAAGIASLMVDAYREHNNGLDPPASLLKAILLNTAEDIGNVGPDYFTGWGRAHAQRALEAVEDETYLQGSVAHNGQVQHQIQIPVNTAQIKIMVYWLDPPSAPMAAKVLVNDLDMSVIQPNGSVRLPWVLSTAPTLDSLIHPAYPGYDRFNNVEQVVINSPAAGNYTIRIRGFNVPQGPQSYHLVYTVIEDKLDLTYPVGGEAMVPGETQVIRWDAIGDAGNFYLEYSMNGTNNWTTINSSVDGDERHYNWVVPHVVNGNMFIRIRRGTEVSMSGAGFSIIGQPFFNFNKDDNQQAFISWSPVPGANQYDIYRLGNKFMEIIGSTADTVFAINSNLGSNDWYSLRAKFNNTIIGRRTTARRYVNTSCETELRLQITFDIYPSETRWELKDYSGNVIASGGPYYGYDTFSTITMKKCVPYGCYRLFLYDSLGDGICCSDGIGHYELYAENGNLLASGGNFDDQVSHYFCVDENSNGNGGGGGIDPDPEPLQIQSVQLSHNTCSGASDGWIEVYATGGTGNYSYLWSNGQSGNLNTQLNSGVYGLIITDGQQQISTSFTILSPNPITASVSTTNINCDFSGGTAMVTAVGGVPPYNFNWSNGAIGPSVGGLGVGNYEVTITDKNNCSLVKSLSIQSSDAIELDFFTADVTCPGSNNGVAIVVATGGQAPYNYLWDNGSTDYFLVNQESGLRAVTVTDVAGCMAVGTITIGSPDEIQVIFNITNPGCNETANGSVEAIVLGGTPPFQLSWSTGQAGNSLNQLSEGTYWVNVIDGNGCSTVETVVLEAVTEMEVSGIIEPVEDGHDGGITIQVNQGQPPYSFMWSNGSTDQNLSGVDPGTYSVTVTDDNGCIATATFILYDVESDYCESAGSSTAYEWIESVQFGPFEQVSGNNGGYAFFDSTGWQFQLGSIYDLFLAPGYAATNYKEYWQIWIDFNQDGDFEDIGEALFSAHAISGMVDGHITMPVSAILGITRMRIAMRYGASPGVCSTSGYGEVEDYSVEIVAGNSNLQMSARPSILQGNNLDMLTEDSAQKTIWLSPNPANNKVKIGWPGQTKGNMILIVSDINGKLWYNQAVNGIELGGEQEIDVMDWPQGAYLVRLQTAEKVFSQKLIVTH